MFFSQVWEFLFYSGLTVLNFLIFGILTKSYKYRNPADDNSDTPVVDDDNSDTPDDDHNVPLAIRKKHDKDENCSSEERAKLWT